MVAAAVLAFRRLGAASVTVGEGPGHRRDTMYVVERSGLGDALRAVEAPFVDLNLDAVERVALRSRYTQLGELWLPRTVTRRRRRGLDAEDEDAPLGRRHALPEELLRVRPVADLRLAEERPALPRTCSGRSSTSPPRSDPTSRSSTASSRWRATGPSPASPSRSARSSIGDDPVATDVVAASIMGVDPTAIAYLDEAGRFLGQTDRDRIDHPGRGPRSAAGGAPARPRVRRRGDRLELGRAARPRSVTGAWHRNRSQT